MSVKEPLNMKCIYMASDSISVLTYEFNDQL